MASKLNEELMNTNLDLPDGEIKIDGAVDPVYADAINVHEKKKEAIKKILKDKQPELKKAFLGTKGETTIMPKTNGMKKLKLAESAFKGIREHMNDAHEAYANIFRVIDNMEHIINYISELTDEELTYEDMQQSYNVLEEAMSEFNDYLLELRKVEKNKTKTEAVATLDEPKKDWSLQDKRNNKDLWSNIYNELCGDIKSIEAPNRKLSAKPSQRYDSYSVAPSHRDDSIRVNAKEESQLDFAKEVADTYGVEYRVIEHTSRYAPYRFEMRIYPDRQVVSESLKESYTEVDTIECGEETYRVVGGGFNSNDALVSVEDKDGNTKRLSSGDVIEFYTWYDKNGNVIHEPSMDESLKEDLKIYRESDLTDFEFWSGARDTVKYLTDDEIKQIGRTLEEIYPDGCTETDINDFFWFEDDTIAEWLGYNSFEEIMERDNKE